MNSQHRREAIRMRVLLGCATALAAVVLGTHALANETAEAHNMVWEGHNDLQGRSAYQPTIHRQGDRVIAYVGHHAGALQNPLTGVVENNGTSLVDVTDPKKPVYLFHIPGPAGGSGESGGAQMVRVCDGSGMSANAATQGKVYMLRSFASQGHEVWDTTDPKRPVFVSKVVSGLSATHKNWWECETGIAYLVANDQKEKWRVNQHMKIYDLSNPASPVYIRDFGLAGQQPGSTGPIPPGVHGPVSVPGKNRIYIAYGVGSNGIIQIVDRDKLLGKKNFTDGLNPTEQELLAPQVGRIDMSPDNGGHTAFPVFGIIVPQHANFTKFKTRDILVTVSESTGNQCTEAPHFAYLLDITSEARPWPISTLEVKDSSGTPNYCSRGARFGAHGSNESFYAPYYGKLIFISYFSAGVRTWDIRDPFHPREVAHFVPPVNAFTTESCATIDGVRSCKKDVMTNNVELDDRGLIYIVDRAGSGLDILSLAGAAKQIVTDPNDRSFDRDSDHDGR